MSGGGGGGVCTPVSVRVALNVHEVNLDMRPLSGQIMSINDKPSQITPNVKPKKQSCLDL